MPTAKTSKALAMYTKEELIASLKDAKARIEETIKTHEEAVAEWRATAPARFADWVANFDVANAHYRPNLSEFEPPRLSEACRDWRVQNLNRAIARIGLMSGDIIKLRADDEVWQYIGLGACL